MTFWLDEHLVPVPGREFDDFVFNRRTITGTNALGRGGVQRGLLQVPSNSFVQGFVRVPDVTVQLLLKNLIGRERKWHRPLIGRLRVEEIPIDCSPIQPWRCAGL